MKKFVPYTGLATACFFIVSTAPVIAQDTPGTANESAETAPRIPILDSLFQANPRPEPALTEPTEVSAYSRPLSRGIHPDSLPVEPMSITLEKHPYPTRVKFLPLRNEGQDVRMAFMFAAPAAGANGRTVVLLHGKNFGGDYWHRTMIALTNAGYRVVVPDQIGFGKSSKPDMPYSFDLLAANTLKLLDTLKVDRAAVVGHSMGGMLAVRFARNYPQRVSHLVLENPIGLEDYRFSVPARTTEFWYQRELENTDPKKIRAFYGNYFTTRTTVAWDVAVPRVGVTLSSEYPRWAKSAALTYQMIYQQPVRHEFPLLKMPTLLVIGQDDRTAIGKDLVPADVAKTLGNYPALGKAAARDIPNAKLVELPGVGHIPHLEAPDAFHTNLLQFLK